MGPPSLHVFGGRHDLADNCCQRLHDAGVTQEHRRKPAINRVNVAIQGEAERPALGKAETASDAVSLGQTPQTSAEGRCALKSLCQGESAGPVFVLRDHDCATEVLECLAASVIHMLRGVKAYMQEDKIFARDVDRSSGYHESLRVGERRMPNRVRVAKEPRYTAVQVDRVAPHMQARRILGRRSLSKALNSVAATVIFEAARVTRECSDES
jgi:hypothetical protein